MAGLIAKQPNGLYCRVSTIVDAPTHWNMTKQDYIDFCVERAKEEAEDTLKNYCRDFDCALSYIRHGKDSEMSDEEYNQFIKDCNENAQSEEDIYE